jgi:hypothetical protein
MNATTIFLFVLFHTCCYCMCSATHTNNRKLILGGRETETSRFPYFAGLLDEAGDLYCGGTLVAPDIVLSAAHCWRPSMPSVAIGGDQKEIVAIESCTVHSGYTKEVLSHDIMLIRLATPSTQTPVRVNLDEFVPAQQGEGITVIGMGMMTDANGHAIEADYLQQVVLEYTSNQQCSNYGENYNNLIQDDMMCAWGGLIDGMYQGWYNGDSGGPLLLLGDGPEEDVQVGVVSFSAIGYPGVASRTSANAVVLRSVICNSSSMAPPYLECDIPSQQKESHFMERDEFGEPAEQEMEGLNDKTIKILAVVLTGVVLMACGVAIFAYTCVTKNKDRVMVETIESNQVSKSDVLGSADAGRTEIIDKDTRKKVRKAKRKSKQRSLTAQLNILEAIDKTEEEHSVVQSPISRRKSFDEALDMALEIAEEGL